MGYTRKCSVPNCKNNSKSCSVRLYTFPKDEELFKTWTKLINRPDILPRHQSLICGLHFDHDEKHTLQCKLFNQDKDDKCKCQVSKGCIPSKHLPEISMVKIEKLEKKKRKSNRKIVQELLKPSSSLESATTSFELSFQPIEQPMLESERVVCEVNPCSYEEMQVFPEPECFVKVEVRDEPCYVQDLCRMCAQPAEQLVPVFGEEGNKQNLKNKMNMCLPIRICEDDGLPQSVCEHCISQLESSFELATSCQDAERLLRRLLGQQEFFQGTGDSIRGNSENFSNNNKKSTSCIDYNQQINPQIVYIKKEAVDSQHVIITHTPQQVTSIHCNLCLTKFKSEEKLKEHDCMFDSTTQIDCQLCSLKFRSSEKLKTHIRNVHYFFTCKSRKGCCQFFSTFEAANTHYEKEHKYCRPSGMCELCGKTFKRTSQLNKHMHYVHGNPENQHKCHLCPKTYRYKQKLIVHLRLHSDDGMIRRHCPHCDKIFEKARALNHHILMQHKDYLFHCECGRGFVSKHNLYVHIKSMHLHTFSYHCSICDILFNDITDVRNHYKSHALDDKLRSNKKEQFYITSEFQCKICLKYFRMQQNLVNHIRVIHELNKSSYASLDKDGILKFRRALSIADPS